MICLATSVDHEAGKLELSLKPSATPISEVGYLNDGEFVHSYFEELARTTQHQAVRIGDCVKATVKQALSYGWIVELEGGVSGFVTIEQSKDAKVEGEGAIIIGKVLDVDVDKSIVDLTVRADLISKEEKSVVSKGSGVDTNLANKKTKSVVSAKILERLESLLKEKIIIDITIELVKEDYLVVSLPQYHNQIAFAATKTFNNRSKPFMRYRPGQKAKARLTHLPKGKLPNLDRVLVTLQTQEDHKKPGGGQNRFVTKPVDETIESFEDYQPGRLTKCVVRSVKESQINVDLAENVKGRIHVSEVADKYTNIKDKRHPLKAFRVGQNLDVKVIGYHDAKTHKYLPITHRVSAAKTVIELTMKPSEMAVEGKVISEATLSLENLKEGHVVTAYVNKIDANGLWVNVSPNVRGRVEILQVSDNLDVVKNLDKHFLIGQAVQCVVISKDLDKHNLDLSIKGAVAGGSSKGFITDFDSVKEGMVVIGRVIKVQLNLGVILQLSDSVNGRVHLTDLVDTYVDEPTKLFTNGQIIQCCIVGVDAQSKQVDLSLRTSRIGGIKREKEDNVKNKDAEVKAVEDLQVGQVIRGYVKNVADKGLFVSLGRNLVARVKIAELSDDYLKDWKGAFKVGQLVSGKVLRLVTGTT